MVLPVVQVFAHPHVFIDAGIDIELDDKGIKGVWHRWTYDEYYSAWCVSEYGPDENGKFSDKKLKLIYEQTFMNLKHHGYLTKVFLGDRPIPVERIENFSVEIKDNHAVYSCFVPLDIKIDKNSKAIYIAVYDESFFSQIVFPAGEVGFKGNVSAWKIDYSTQEMPELTYYFGFMVPTAVKLTINPS